MGVVLSIVAKVTIIVLVDMVVYTVVLTVVLIVIVIVVVVEVVLFLVVVLVVVALETNMGSLMSGKGFITSHLTKVFMWQYRDKKLFASRVVMATCRAIKL